MIGRTSLGTRYELEACVESNSSGELMPALRVEMFRGVDERSEMYASFSHDQQVLVAAFVAFAAPQKTFYVGFVPCTSHKVLLRANAEEEAIASESRDGPAVKRLALRPFLLAHPGIYSVSTISVHDRSGNAIAQREL